jgi:hypothetical protein
MIFYLKTPADEDPNSMLHRSKEEKRAKFFIFLIASFCFFIKYNNANGHQFLHYGTICNETHEVNLKVYMNNALAETLKKVIDVMRHTHVDFVLFFPYLKKKV